MILHGVPGLPSVSLPASSTYADVRCKIVERASNLRNFYFETHSLIIKDEDAAIDRVSGHLVLNVHTCGDLPGVSMKSSSDNEGKGRYSNEVCDMERLLL